MQRPTVCLVMIVKNEEHVVRETLECARDHIDTWVVVDTGSTDRTREVIRTFFDEAGIPGELHERPWRDFGTNRTEALALGRGKADYAWMLDADDVVVGELDLSRLTLDAYKLRFGPDFVYWRLQIFRTELDWRYVGVVHEYAECASGSAREGRLEGDYHLVSRRLGDRNRARDKYRRDAALLERALEQDPDDPRSVFYLAQSLYDDGDIEAALERYLQRARMGGWSQEVFYSWFRAGICHDKLGHPWEQALAAHLEAWQASPTRAESLHAIARHYRKARQFPLGHLFAGGAREIPRPGEALFVYRDVYDWQVEDELSICAYYVGRHRECFDTCSAMLRQDRVPDEHRARVVANRDFAVPSILDETARRPGETIGRLTSRRARGKREVTLTITTCKRPGLFERTVNSFLACCRDIDLVDRFICIDDGSSDEDRRRMKEIFPFFEFIWKRPEDRGHARSMNILLDEIDSPWWLHLEDDWHFFSPEEYVGTALAILEDDERLGQLLFNRNYGEELSCRDLAGGEVVHTTRDGLRYRLHTYIPRSSPEYGAYFAGLPAGTLGNVYWPHYSLRPSVLRMSAVRDAGRYDPSADHFELDFARRWTARGWRSAFLDVITCLHTGRLTRQRGEDGVPNAYDLNEERQFGKP